MSDTTQSDVVVDSSPQVEVVEPIEAEKVEIEGEQPEVETKEAEKEPDESSLPEGVKKRIDKVTRQKYEAVAEANRYKAELEQLRAQIAPRQEAPDISQFDDVEKYIDAVADYKLQQKQQEATQYQATQNTAQKVAQEWTSKVDEVRKGPIKCMNWLMLAFRPCVFASTGLTQSSHYPGSSPAFMSQISLVKVAMATLPPDKLSSESLTHGSPTQRDFA